MEWTHGVDLPSFDNFDQAAEDQEALEVQDNIRNETHRERRFILLDIAKKYLSHNEMDILFLFLRNRRNKAISTILDIPEPEIARYKNLIIRKCSTYYKYKYELNMNVYLEFCKEVFKLNDKQAKIFELFLDFRSLADIAEEIGSKPSNMHRSLKSLRQKIEIAVIEFPSLQHVLDFYQDSRYINNKN